MTMPSAAEKNRAHFAQPLVGLRSPDSGHIMAAHL